MVIDLVLLGVFQGYFWAALLPWQESVDVSQPFWATRVFAGLAMFAGFLCFLYNLARTYWSPATETGVANAPAMA